MSKSLYKILLSALMSSVIASCGPFKKNSESSSSGSQSVGGTPGFNPQGRKGSLLELTEKARMAQGTDERQKVNDEAAKLASQNAVELSGLMHEITQTLMDQENSRNNANKDELNSQLNRFYERLNALQIERNTLVAVDPTIENQESLVRSINTALTTLQGNILKMT